MWNTKSCSVKHEKVLEAFAVAYFDGNMIIAIFSIIHDSIVQWLNIILNVTITSLKYY